MQKLAKGVHAFQQETFPSKKELFETLHTKGQSPETLFIACSDSRVSPDLITHSEPGDLFEIRNAGNIVLPYGAGDPGGAGTIEYAVAALKVKHIVVCGHSHCGAMTGLLNLGSLEALPAVKEWVCHAEATRRVIEENHGDLTDPAAKLKATIEQNVLLQLDNLKTHPSVAAALARGDLELHGWVYEFETGQVYAHDASKKAFAPLAEAARA